MNFLQTLDENLKKTFQPSTPDSNLVKTIATKIGADKAPVPIVTPTRPVVMSTPKTKAPDIAGMAVKVVRTPFQAIAQGLHDTIGALKGDEPSAFKAQDPIGKFILGDKPLKTGQDYINEYSNSIQKSKEAGVPSYQSVPLSILAFGGSIAGEALGPVGGEDKKAGELIFKNAFKNLVEDAAKITSETDAYKLLREAGISHDLATIKAPLVSSTTDLKAVKTILNDTAAEQIQTTQKLAQAKLDSFDARVKNGEILSHADMTEQNFLKKNINKPEELVHGYQDTAPIPKPKVPLQNERSYITSAKASEKVAEEIKSELSGVYDAKSNADLVARANERVASNIADAKTLATTEATDEAIATGVSLTEHYSNAIANTADKAEKIALAKEAADIINKQAVALTEAGRTVQAASLIDKTSPEGLLRSTSRMIQDYNKTAKVKLPGLTPETVIEVLETGKKIEGMADGLEKQVATKKLVDKLESLIPSTMWKKVVNVWKAGLLTGVKTSGVNIQSNFWNGVGENVKNIPATGIDLATSYFTGKRTKALNLRGLLDGSAEGFKKGFDYLKTGISDESAKSGLEFSKVHYDSLPGKALGAYAEGVYRVLGAEDMPFFYGALNRSLGEQALVAIKNEGKVFASSAEKNAWIKDFMKNPPDEAFNLADMDAKIATFRNDTALGNAATSVRNATPLAEVILPFAKTPSAVATQMFNYTPAGAVVDILKMVKDGKFDQRVFADSLGRSVTGTAALWLGSELYKSGRISLEYPADEKTRAQWEATGKIPNSILINGKWVPLVQFGPQGSVLGIGGYVEKGKQETGSLAGGVISGLFGGVKGLTEQTFLTGVKNLTDSLNDPEGKGTALVGGLVASVIPTVISDFTQAFDPYQRKSSGTILGPIKARIPGVRETLPIKLDVWGQKLERNRSGVETAISPIRLSNTIQGPLNTEVERLGQLGEDIRPTKVDSTISSIKLDPKEYYVYQRVYGDLLVKGLTTLINSPDYQKQDSETQAKVWKDGVSQIRKAVAENVLPSFIQQRYNLPDTVDLKLATELTTALYKKSPEFAKENPEIQGKVILNLLQKQ